MKIVFLAKFFDKAGTTTHMLTLGRNYIQKGHEVLLLCGKPRDNSELQLKNEFLNAGFKLQLLPLRPRLNSRIISNIGEIVRYSSSSIISILRIRKFKPDIIHVHWPIMQGIAKVYKKIYKTPFITTLHIKDAPRSFLHQKPDAIIAISTEVKDDAIKIYGMKDEEIFTIFNGVDEKKFNYKLYKYDRDQLCEKFNITKEKVNILHVGSNYQRKGVDILLEASRILKRKKIDFNIIIVGSGDKEWLNNIISKNELDKNVYQFEFQNPLEFYYLSDILVLASRKEGFPLVPIEGMMMGKAIVRSNVEGSYDQIKNGYNGFIFENGNINELADCLERLIKDIGLRKGMGENAITYARKRFTVDIMASKTLDVYKEIICRGRKHEDTIFNNSK